MTAARLSIAAVITYQVMLIALIFVRPDLDPSWHTISEWAIGRYGWMMVLAFLVSALSYGSLFVAVKSQVRALWGRIGLGLLLICTIGTVGVGVLVTDPMPLTPQHGLSTRGALHLISGSSALMLLPFAALLINLSPHLWRGGIPRIPPNTSRILRMRNLVRALLILLAASQAQAQDSLAPQTLTVPAGTRLQAQMQRQLHTRRAKPGETVYLQTTFPLTSNDTVLIPAGSHLLATIDSVAPHILASRVDFQLHVTNLIYANGYVVTTSNPAHAVTVEKEGLRAESGGAKGALLLGLTAPGAGAAIGAASDSDARSLGIGSAIGSVVGLTALVFGATHGTDVVLDAGLPMEVELQAPLTLDARPSRRPLRPTRRGRAGGRGASSASASMRALPARRIS
jgi:uncharacterized protein DUF998